MKYDRLYNFISPVTGKLPIDRDYILLGDKDGRSFVSPILIDVRQDIIDLKRKIGNFEELKKLDHNRIWIGDYDNEPVAQLNIGVINLPPLAEAVFPNPVSSKSGDYRIPNPTFDYLSTFDWVMSGPFLPQIYATKYDTLGNPIGTDISSSLAMTQVRSAQIMKRFDNSNFIVGSSNVTFNWENPKMYLIPESLKQLYGLGTTYTFTKAQSLGALETGLLKNTVTDSTGILSKAIAGTDYVEITNIPIGPLVVYNGQKFISPTSSKVRKNKPDEFGKLENQIEVLEADYVATKNVSLLDIEAGSLLKVNSKYEIAKAIGDQDYSLVTTVNNIKDKLDIINRYLVTVTAMDKVPGPRPPGVPDDPKFVTDFFPDNTGSSALDLINNPIYNTIANNPIKTSLAVTAAVASIPVIGAGIVINSIAKVLGVSVLLKNNKSDNFDNSTSLFEQLMIGLDNILNYSYVDKTGISSTAKNDIPIIPTISGTSVNFMDRTFVEYRPLLSENKFFDTDNLTDWGKGNIWYDNDNYDGKGSEKNRPGLRITAWDSSLLLATSDPMVPHSIGVFGYDWNYFNNPRTQKGFVWEAEYENDKNSYNYRFPKKFSLRDVGHNKDNPGWNLKDNELMNFDLYDNKFYYKRVVTFQEHVIIEPKSFSNINSLETGSLFLHTTTI